MPAQQYQFRLDRDHEQDNRLSFLCRMFRRHELISYRRPTGIRVDRPWMRMLATTEKSLEDALVVQPYAGHHLQIAFCCSVRPARSESASDALGAITI